MCTASSASRTYGRSPSASEYTATVLIPIRRAVRITRLAISPRLATSTESSIRPAYCQRAKRAGEVARSPASQRAAASSGHPASQRAGAPHGRPREPKGRGATRTPREPKGRRRRLDRRATEERGGKASPVKGDGEVGGGPEASRTTERAGQQSEQDNRASDLDDRPAAY